MGFPFIEEKQCNLLGEVVVILVGGVGAGCLLAGVGLRLFEIYHVSWTLSLEIHICCESLTKDSKHGICPTMILLTPSTDITVRPCLFPGEPIGGCGVLINSKPTTQLQTGTGDGICYLGLDQWLANCNWPPDFLNSFSGI